MLRLPMTTAYFLLVHDTFSGKRQVKDELLGCGVVGAELGELTIGGRLTVETGKVVIAHQRPDRSEPIAAAYVVDSVRRQAQPHTVRTWAENLSSELTEMTAEAAVAHGLAHRQVIKWPRRSVRYPSADLTRAAAGRVRVEHALRHPNELDDVRVAFLVALVFATGVQRLLDPAIDREQARYRVDQITEQLPGALPELLAGIAAATAAVSLRVRR